VTLLVRRARQGDPASRWLAVAAVAWGAAFLAQGAGAGAVTPAAIQLTLTDLLALLGLPPLAMGLLRLAGPASTGRPASPGEPPAARRLVSTGRILDGSLLGLAVFCVGWITLLRPAYAAAGVAPGTFSVDLVHPAADLIALGGTLGLAVAAGRRALAPYLALCAATVGDFLAVQARAGGSHPGIAAQLAWLAAICLLGATALSPRRAARPLSDGAARPDSPLTTVIALGSAGVAALVTLLFAVLTWGHSGPVPLLAGAVLMLALVARIAGLLSDTAAMSVLTAQAGRWHLAARAGNAVAVLAAWPPGPGAGHRQGRQRSDRAAQAGDASDFP
jgi:hypothetical protein